MRKLFIIFTIFFWLAMTGFWLLDSSQPSKPAPANHPAAEPAEKYYTLSEVEKHHRENDCWMVIEGQVYDITTYLPMHPSDPGLILPWCGKESTQAWQTKTVGRSHSSRAHQLLEKYLIGHANESR